VSADDAKRISESPAYCPQNLRPDEEYESAMDLFVKNEYKILRRLGYV